MSVRKKVDSFLEKGLSLLLVIMVVNVLWQIASRYVLNKPSIFTDELARYLLIWIGLIGAAYGSGKGTHVAIDLFKNKLSEGTERIRSLFIQGIVILFAISILIIGGIRLVLISFDLGQTSSAMQLPIGYVYLALPISGILICFYTLDNLLKNK